MLHPFTANRATAAFVQESTLVVVIEMSQSTWLVGGSLPGVERQPLKKLEPDPDRLLSVVNRWRDECRECGHDVERLVIAYEAGRDGFWLARWLAARGAEAHVIHASSVAVSRDRRRAKTDRLDVALLLRVLLGWLRGERGHCSMAVTPSIEDEDARRPTRERENLVSERTRIINRMKASLARLGIRDLNPAHRKAVGRLDDLCTPEGAALPPLAKSELRRDMTRLRFIEDQIKEIEQERMARLDEAAPREERPNGMIRLLTRVVGVGVETADMLTHEIFLRDLGDRRAVARYAGLTGSPDESGSKRRERGLSRAGNPRVRRGMVQLAWRFLVFQKDCALVRWFRARTAEAGARRRVSLIVALARKLLVALWRLAMGAGILEGLKMRPA
ncbi:IS110 family transposase [Alsobacter sp. KACC 23698]|uniref:IS110 family transposase n=1 Tax=Alsobacter sp. KACC 23698 TaxID=3149229 RepID=A0AAU7JK96_9HYPH